MPGGDIAARGCVLSHSNLARGRAYHTFWILDVNRRGSYKSSPVSSFVRSFVRPLVTHFSQYLFIRFFWNFPESWVPGFAKKWRFPIFQENSSFFIIIRNMQKIALFCQFPENASLLFSETFQEVGHPDILKSGYFVFFRKIRIFIL